MADLAWFLEEVGLNKATAVDPDVDVEKVDRPCVDVVLKSELYCWVEVWLRFCYGGLVNVPVNQVDVKQRNIQNRKLFATPAELQGIGVSSNCYSPAGKRGSRMASVFGALFEMRLLSVQKAIAVLSFTVLYTTYWIAV